MTQISKFSNVHYSINANNICIRRFVDILHIYSVSKLYTYVTYVRGVKNLCKNKKLWYHHIQDLIMNIR